MTPILEVSGDGGKTWTPRNFGSTGVREVLAIDYVTDSQINLIAKTGAACSITMVTSFTSGEFWASYPERTAEAVYFDSGSAGTVSVDGAPVPSPCANLVDVEGFSGGAVALCREGILIYDIASASWRVLTTEPASAMTVAGDGSRIITTVDGAAFCDGVGIQAYITSDPQPDAQNLACITRDVAQPDTTLASAGDSVFLWSDSSVLTSADQGATWTQLR